MGERFRLVELIAKGGMGRVYRAIQSPLGREVAVKVLDLSESVEDDGQFRSRFFREASICSKLSHPNTVRVFDYGQDGETYYLVMELLLGRTLHRLVKDEGPLEPLRALRIVRQIARGLHQAHQQGVIHRDLKPANIFVCDHGEEEQELEFVKVLDFGLVKPLDAGTQVTRAGNILGSPAYMAPEQVMGEPVSPSTDVYSLAACMFVLLTRELPFRRDHPMAVLNAQVNAPPPTLGQTLPDRSFPAGLEWIMARALEKRPERRPVSMREFERALRRVEHELLGQGPSMPMQLIEGRLYAEGMESVSELSAPGLERSAQSVAGIDQERSIGEQPTLALTAEPAERSPFAQFAMGLGVAAALFFALAAVGGASGYAWWVSGQPEVASEAEDGLGGEPVDRAPVPKVDPASRAQIAGSPPTPGADPGAGDQAIEPPGAGAKSPASNAAKVDPEPKAAVVSETQATPEVQTQDLPGRAAKQPSGEVSGEPTGEPTDEPTGEPTDEPTGEPTGKPKELRDPWGNP